MKAKNLYRFMHPSIGALIFYISINFCFVTGTVRAQDVTQTPDLLMSRSKSLGDQAFEEKNYSLAASYLEEGLAIAESERNTELESYFNFKLGLTFQQQSFELNNEENINRAIAHYERYLQIKPRSGGVYNNLAQLYAEVGQIDRAKSLYERAIAFDDERKGFYALNLAKLLSAQGEAREAARYYRITLAEHPDHPEARQGLTDAYLQADVAGLISTLWDQIRGRREIDATMTALEALTRLSRSGAQNDRDISRQKIELLTCVAAGLSRAHVGPSFLSDAEAQKADLPENARQAARMLRNLASDETIGDGVRELIKVFDKPVLDERDKWWAEKGNRRRDPDEGWWPRDAFRMLLRSLGDWYRLRDNDRAAIAYLRLSNELTTSTDREPDLVALIDLSEIYARQGNVRAIDDLLEAYSPNLFEGKGQAYKNSELRKIYAFHRTLGIMYGLTENWGSLGNVRSAMFQLDAALKTRIKYNEETRSSDKLQPIGIEPRLVNLLARGYEATGNGREGVQLQFDYAGELLKSEEPSEARQILNAINTDQLNRRDRRKYEELDAEFKVKAATVRAMRNQ